MALHLHHLSLHLQLNKGSLELRTKTFSTCDFSAAFYKTKETHLDIVYCNVKASYFISARVHDRICFQELSP